MIIVGGNISFEVHHLNDIKVFFEYQKQRTKKIPRPYLKTLHYFQCWNKKYLPTNCMMIIYKCREK